MKNFNRLPADYRNFIVGLAALLVLALFWGASSLARGYTPVQRARAQQIEAQAQEEAQREALERATVLQARYEARAVWTRRVEAARGVATIALLSIAVVAAGAFCALAVARRAQQLRLPAHEPLRRGAHLFATGALDTETGAFTTIGVARDPQLAQARALAAILQARHGLPRREALPLAWREVQALTVEG